VRYARRSPPHNRRSTFLPPSETTPFAPPSSVSGLRRELQHEHAVVGPERVDSSVNRRCASEIFTAAAQLAVTSRPRLPQGNAWALANNFTLIKPQGWVFQAPMQDAIALEMWFNVKLRELLPHWDSLMTEMLPLTLASAFLYIDSYTPRPDPQWTVWPGRAATHCAISTLD